MFDWWVMIWIMGGWMISEWMRDDALVGGECVR